MKRFLAVCAALAIGSQAFALTDKEISTFVTDLIKKNPGVTVKSVKVMGRTKIDGADGWEAVRVLSDLAVERNGQKQEFKTPEIFFTKGDLIAPDLMDGKKDKNFKQVVQPKITAAMYDAEHFIAGGKNAKYKLVVFSDPLCPFCRDFTPDLVVYAQKNPDKIALWHYAFPLTSIHPASLTLTKAEMILHDRGVKDALTKVYHTEVDPMLADEEKILAKLNQEIGTNLTKADINTKKMAARYEAEVAFGNTMLVKGTPTLFINDELDVGRAKFTEIAKELKGNEPAVPNKNSVKHDETNHRH